MANTERARTPADTPAPRPDRSITPAPPVGFRLPEALTSDTARATTLAWITTRLLTVAAIALFGRTVNGDVDYYAQSLLGLMAETTSAQTLPEYPLPVLGLLVPQFLFAAGNAVAFSVVFVASMLALDAVFTALLWHVSGHRRTEAVTFWLWFVPAVGPLAYFRFDMVLAVLAGAAVLAAIRYPALSGALTALGTALKLWPAVLLPIFLIRRVDRVRVLAAFAGVGAVTVLFSLWVGGIDRLFSPLHWQSERGLQIESVPASPLMLVRAWDPDAWLVITSTFKSAEIFGTGVGTSLVLTEVMFFGGLLLLGWMLLRARMLPAVSAETLAWLIVATAAIMMVTNKVLSPQYVLWLAGPLAALMVRAPGDPTVRRAARLLMAIGVLTQLIFPVLYSYLMEESGATMAVTLLLVLRNALLVWFTYIACRQVWLQTRQETCPPAASAVRE